MVKNPSEPILFLYIRDEVVIFGIWAKIQKWFIPSRRTVKRLPDFFEKSLYTDFNVYAESLTARLKGI